MQKKLYEELEISIIMFDKKDVITASAATTIQPPTKENDETDILPMSDWT